MRITHRMMAGGIHYRLGQGLARLDRYFQQLATGKIFQHPSQNPVGLVKVLHYGTLIKRNEQYRLNMNEAERWLESTEDSLRNALDTLQRLRELSVYGANEALTAEDRCALAPEVLELYRYLLDTANTEYNGLYLFAGHQTLEPPFVEHNLYGVEVDQASGLDTGTLQADGLQNGAYRLAFVRTLSAGETASLETVHTCLGDAIAGSIFGPGSSIGIEDAADLEQNASILLEVVSADPATGEVLYRYTAHRYDLDGNYTLHEGETSLLFSGAPGQILDLGAVRVAVNGLEAAAPEEAGHLTAGDRAVLNLLPARQADLEYQEVQLTGEHCGGGSSFRAVFNDGTLDGGDRSLRFFTLNTFPRSPFRGEVYHGSVTLKLSGAFGESNRAAIFQYDREGFPAYRGDSGNRELGISPHQVMALNLTGPQVFGTEQEIFQAARAAYWALAENDRTRLGGAVLEGLDEAIGALLQRISEVGARQKRVETMQETLFSENLYLREMRSRVEDIDLALTIAEFTMQESAYQAALATAARIMPLSLVDFLR